MEIQTNILKNNSLAIIVNFHREPKNSGVFGKKASLENGNKITAWYSSNLKFQNNPEMYTGLRGLIFEIEELENKNGEIRNTSLTAISVEMSKNQKSIVNPLEL